MKKYFQAPWHWKYLGIAALASLFCLAINFIICMVIIYGNWKIPGYRFEEGILNLSSKNLILTSLIGLIYVIIAPVLEESIFRGLSLQYLTAKLGIKWSIPITILISVLIGLPFHSPIPALIFSSIATFITIKNNSIWPAIIFHIANNLVIFGLLLSVGKGLITL
ncbi:MAG: CPBP family intramembrane metalloprotease [Candidatus Peregrinibacteria bacterium]|nr:CPBP family intramembrane metalloprotease [Candidatus Peregrinibacteria bacterium]